MWYICAMFIKSLAVVAVLLAVTQTPMPGSGQAANNSRSNQQTPPPSTASNAGPQSTGSPAGKGDCNGFPCDEQQPHVIVTLPAPAPTPWLWRDRIAWGANLLLALVGYVGIMLALLLLKRIDRQTRFAEAAAETASNNAHAALLHAQAIIESERPWLVITVEPALNVENSFTVMATNRGRSPALIVGTLEQIMIAINEAALPFTPQYEDREPKAPLVPIILLPGESTSIKPFNRDDLKGICESEAELKRVENWQEKVFIYGKLIYRDLIAPSYKQAHETNWFCWYIHGRQKSGLVIAGPPSYNVHT